MDCDIEHILYLDYHLESEKDEKLKQKAVKYD
jgi:hypothetical protein